MGRSSATVDGYQMGRTNAQCDRRLHRLICYVDSMADGRIRWGPPHKITAHLFADADFAGCPYTLRSTSGCQATLAGPNASFPWAASSARQTSLVQSLQQAEAVSIHEGITDQKVLFTGMQINH